MKYQQLSQKERYHIACLSRRRISIQEIAADLNRSPITISRELRRNRSTHDDGYRAEVALKYSTARRRRERRGSHFSNQQWDLIFFMVKMRFNLFSISHESIYNHLLHDKRKGGT